MAQHEIQETGSSCDSSGKTRRWRFLLAAALCLMMCPPLGLHGLFIAIQGIVQLNVILVLLGSALLYVFLILPAKNISEFGNPDSASFGLLKNRWLMYFYFAVSAACAFISLWTFTLTSPLFLVCTIAVAVAAGKYLSAENTNWKFLGLMAAFALPTFVLLKFFFIAPLVFFLVLVKARRISFRTPFMTAFCGAVIILSLARAAAIIETEDSKGIDRILAQEGVSAVLTARSEFRDKTPESLRFISEDCTGENYLIGGRSGRGKDKYDLFLVNKERPEEFKGLLKSEAAPDELTFDCRVGLMFYGGYDSGNIYVFRLPDYELLTTIDSGLGAVTNLAVNEKKHRLYTGSDINNEIRIINYSRMKKPKISSIKVQSSDFLHREKSLYVIGNIMNVGRGRFEKTKRLWVLGLEIKMAADESRRRIYVTDFTSGLLMELDMDSLQMIRQGWLGPGIRFVESDPARNRVYVGNYISGNIDMVDPDSMKKVRTIYSGSRVRTMTLSKDGRYLLFVSSAGAFKLDLETSQ